MSIIKDQLDWITSQYARQINSPNFEVNPIILLRAIAHIESSYGIHNYPRFEKSWYVYGGNFKRLIEKDLRPLDLVFRYGANVACSFSSFQILYWTARDMGFRDDPIYLMKDTEAIPYVVKYCNWKLRTAKNIDEFADMYNSGAIDKYVPKFYIIKFKTKYEELINE